MSENLCISKMNNKIKNILKKVVNVVRIITIAPLHESIKLRQLVNGKNKAVYTDYYMEI